MQKFKLGIIGMGRMGITHYSIINSHPDVEINAIADTSKLVVNMLGKYVKGLTVFDNYVDLLNSGLVDAVLICTPPFVNYPIISMAASKRIHLFSEKPFVTKSIEGKELTQLFQNKNLVNQVGYVNRYNDVFIKTKSLLEQNTIGKIVRYKSEMFTPTVIKPNKESGWRASNEEGGGVIFEIASHLIDLTNYFFSKPLNIIGTSINQVYSKNVEDIVSSTFIYQNGITGTLYVNWSDESYRKSAIKFEVFGTDGKIEADQHGLKIYLKQENKNKKLRKGWNYFNFIDLYKPVPFYVRGNDFTRQLYDFVKAIKNKKHLPLCTFKDGTETVNIIEAMFNDVEINKR